MEETRNIVIDVSLRPNDVYTPFQWSRGNFARWVAAIVLCLIFSDLYRNSRQALLSFDGGESILAIVVLLSLLILFGLVVFPYLRMRALFKKSAAATKVWRYTFSDVGVSITTDVTNSVMQWGAFQKAHEMPRLFLLFSSPLQCFYLPKRCFNSPETILQLREMFRKHMSGKITLRND
jgi:hypothetical protein